MARPRRSRTLIDWETRSATLRSSVAMWERAVLKDEAELARSKSNLGIVRSRLAEHEQTKPEK